MKSGQFVYNILRIVFSGTLILVLSCSENEEIENFRTWDGIEKSGKLVVLLSSNSTDYFIYRGEPMGFNYELINMFCDRYHLQSEIIRNNDIDQSIRVLGEGKCDIMALNLNHSPAREELLDFTNAVGNSRHVLVQRKHDKKSESKPVRLPKDFNNLTVHVQKNTIFENLLRKFSVNFNQTVNIVVDDSLEVEELICEVSEGKIDYTLSDEMVAKVCATYQKNIDFKTALTKPQDYFWAVNLNSDSLKTVFNSWLDSIKTTKTYKNLYIKYYENSRSSKMLKSKYHSFSSEILSDYDDIIKTYAKEIHWDWRLLASLIYHESRFQPDVRSWAGAIGLMQMMPVTARRFGADSVSSPSQNIMAGVRYIHYLEKTFFSEIPNPDDRIKFILASYNLGPGHVLDAMELAKKYGKNDKKWDDHVEFYLMHKSNKKYYLDKVVKNGYCRGQDACDFVDDILERYMNYRNIIPD